MAPLGRLGFFISLARATILAVTLGSLGAREVGEGSGVSLAMNFRAIWISEGLGLRWKITR